MQSLEQSINLLKVKNQLIPGVPKTTLNVLKNLFFDVM